MSYDTYLILSKPRQFLLYRLASSERNQRREAFTRSFSQDFQGRERETGHFVRFLQTDTALNLRNLSAEEEEGGKERERKVLASYRVTGQDATQEMGRK